MCGCDREASIMRRAWPTRGCCAIGEGEKFFLNIKSKYSTTELCSNSETYKLTRCETRKSHCGDYAKYLGPEAVYCKSTRMHWHHRAQYSHRTAWRHIQECSTPQLTNYFHLKFNPQFVTATVYVVLRGLKFVNQI